MNKKVEFHYKKNYYVKYSGREGIIRLGRGLQTLSRSPTRVWFRRGFCRQRFRRKRRERFRFSFRLRFGRVFQHRFRFVFLRQSVQFSSFGDDDLRLLTRLGEDGELRGGALFATTGLVTFRVGVGLGHLS